MAKVQVQVVGGTIQQKEADTLGELAEIVDAKTLAASVNGEPETNMSYELEDFQFVSFSRPVKAGV